MTKKSKESLNRSYEKNEIHRVTSIVELKYLEMKTLKIANPLIGDMMSEENPLREPILSMLLWGYDDTYLTAIDAKHLREAFTVLVALEAGKSFENRIDPEQS